MLLFVTFLVAFGGARQFRNWDSLPKKAKRHLLLLNTEIEKGDMMTESSFLFCSAGANISCVYLSVCLSVCFVRTLYHIISYHIIQYIISYHILTYVSLFLSVRHREDGDRYGVSKLKADTLYTCFLLKTSISPALILILRTCPADTKIALRSRICVCVCVCVCVFIRNYHVH